MRAHWLMADPAYNPQFRRCWLEPPGLKDRQRRPGGGDAGIGGFVSREQRDSTTDITAEQAHATAAALFRTVAA